MTKQKPRIMVVDDEPLLSELIQAIGSRSGWDVDVFSQVEPAVQAFSADQDKYDAAIIDVCLGDDWGPDLAKAIKVADPDFMVMFMTASEEGMLEKALAEVPGVPVIRKPFKLSEFRDKVRRALLGRRGKTPHNTDWR